VLVEGNTGSAFLSFNVSLSQPGGQIITVNYATSNGTARAGFDYQPDNGTLGFPAGVSNRAVQIAVFGDTAIEPDEMLALHLNSPAGATLADAVGMGTIQNDDGLAGQVSTLVWDPISPTQLVSQPFAATITARDAFNNVASNFAGPVWLSSRVVNEQSIGSGTNTTSLPLATFFHDARLQSIYLAGELGGPRRLTALALDVAAAPGQFLNRWTIRMKHTAQSNYTGGAAWEGTGWATVYQTNQLIGGAGWVTFEFAAPFDYNGVDHLLIDFSFNNSSYSSNGLCRATTTAEPRSIFHRTDSGFGDPLAWSGTGPPTPALSSQLPNLRLFDGPDVVVSPAVSGPFTNGVWAGDLTVGDAATNLVLRADDNDGHVGLANPIAVVTMVGPAPDSDGDGLPDAYESAHGLDPLDPADAAADADGDRASNYAEFMAGTNPRDAANHLCILSSALEGGEFRLAFTTVAGRRYCVERSGDGGSHWTRVGGDVVGTGAPAQVTDTVSPAATVHLYRVRVLP
jgi:hypothetical protein